MRGIVVAAGCAGRILEQHGRIAGVVGVCMADPDPAQIGRVDRRGNSGAARGIGPRATTISAIAERAGVQRPTEAQMAAVRDYIAGIAAELIDCVTSEEGVSEALSATVHPAIELPTWQSLVQRSLDDAAMAATVGDWIRSQIR